jgi:hypothetical protein
VHVIAEGLVANCGIYHRITFWTQVFSQRVGEAAPWQVGWWSLANFAHLCYNSIFLTSRSSNQSSSLHGRCYLSSFSSIHAAFIQTASGDELPVTLANPAMSMLTSSTCMFQFNVKRISFGCTFNPYIHDRTCVQSDRSWMIQKILYCQLTGEERKFLVGTNKKKI